MPPLDDAATAARAFIDSNALGACSTPSANKAVRTPHDTDRPLADMTRPTPTPCRRRFQRPRRRDEAQPPRSARRQPADQRQGPPSPRAPSGSALPPPAAVPFIALAGPVTVLVEVPAETMRRAHLTPSHPGHEPDFRAPGVDAAALHGGLNATLVASLHLLV